MGSFDILRGWENGQIAAILNKVSGGDRGKLEALLRDEFEVNFVEKILKFVDRNGRVTPHKSLKNVVCDPNKKFWLMQPKLETADKYEARKVRLQCLFKLSPFPTTAEFQGRANELIGEIKNNKEISSLLKGVCLPVILPKLVGAFGDYGVALDQVFMPAVKSSYEQQFQGRNFRNYRENDLAGKVSIVDGSRHERLVKKMMQGYVVGIYFPNPLQGFSVLASREQLSCLPKSFLLAGGFDTAVAMAMYPDVLSRDWYTPGLDLSALIWRSPVCSLVFRASDGRLGFGGRGDLGYAHDLYSSSLLFLGSA